MQGAIVLVVVLGVFYMYTKNSEDAKKISNSNETPKPAPQNITATQGKTDTLRDILKDVGDIIGGIRDVVDGAQDRNKN